MRFRTQSDSRVMSDRSRYLSNIYAGGCNESDELGYDEERGFSDGFEIRILSFNETRYG